MKRTNIYLPDQIKSQLEALSEEKGIKVAELVRRALEEYLEREKAKKQNANKLG